MMQKNSENNEFLFLFSRLRRPLPRRVVYDSEMRLGHRDDRRSRRRLDGEGGEGDVAAAEESRGADSEEEEEEDQLVASCMYFQGIKALSRLIRRPLGSTVVEFLCGGILLVLCQLTSSQFGFL